MLIVTLRTDKPEAEVGLYDDSRQLAYEVWHAHRTLAETLLQKIEDVLKSQDKTWQDLGGIVVFQGPGSFTGLRIGITVANTITQGQGIPIAGGNGDQWLERAIDRLVAGENDEHIMPEYGADPHITAQKK